MVILKYNKVGKKDQINQEIQNQNNVQKVKIIQKIITLLY